MKTIHIPPEQMSRRVARFRDLKPLPAQTNRDIPQAAADQIYARKLYSVIGLEGGAATPINAGAPILGAGGMTMVIASCPPGQGPSLHAHRKTYETFTVLKGRFELSWNDRGENTLVLETFDTISVPPEVARAFRNVGDEEGLLQVIITGGVHDMEDIAFAPAVAEKIAAIKPEALAAFEKAGMKFDAAMGGA
jgi:quercetin dioxygenase-like cupin family protein